MENDILQQLLDDDAFRLVSFAPKSIPTPGSSCRTKKYLHNDLPVEKVIRHKTGHITLKIADIGYLKFWRERG